MKRKPRKRTVKVSVKVSVSGLNCAFANKRVQSESYGVGVGKNPSAYMKIRERCWVGCTFQKFLSDTGGYCSFNIERIDGAFAYCLCIEDNDTCLYEGELFVFCLDEKCRTPKFLPNPEELIQRRNAIRELWSKDEEKKRRVEGTGETGFPFLQNDPQCPQRWKRQGVAERYAA